MKTLVPATFLAFFGCSPCPGEAAPPRAALDESQRTFLREHCTACHNADKQKGKVRLDEISFVLDDIPTADLWQKVLNSVNSGEMPPEDEPQPADEAKAAFLDALSATLVTARAALSDVQGEITMRRLNRREYKNTIRDLLGVKIVVRDLPSDGGSGSFDTVGSSLFMSSDQFEQYLDLGRRALDEHFARMGPAQAPQPQKLRKDSEEWASATAILQRREVELHANAMVGGTYNGYFKGGHEAAKKFLETGEPQKGIPDEAEAKFRVKVFEEHGPSFERYLNDPLTKRGAYLTIYNVHTEELITLPPDQPSGWLKTKHEVEQAEPGEYMLRFHIGVVPGTPQERHFVELGSRMKPEEREDFTLMQTFQISGTTDAPQTIEVPVSITAGGPRSFVLREKRDVKLDHEVYTAARKETKVGPPSALWIDWVEWEGPIRGAAAEAESGIPPVLFSGETDARAVLERFASRAFRGKTPSAAYLDKLTALHDARLKSGDPFDKAIREPLSVILASPGFLYLQESGLGFSPRAEDGIGLKPKQLSQPELASRLSYFLWSAPPDETLLEADLGDPAALAREVDRLIASPKADEFVSGFVHQWLHLDRLDFFQFDTKQFRDFDESAKAAARREVYETFAHLLRSGGSLSRLLKSDEVHVNGLLATYYGIEGVSGDEFRPVRVPEGSPRGGLLGMAAVLAMGSNGERTSPVERGVWVLRYLLNDPPPPAPPNVPQLDRLDGQPVSPRERLAAHMEEAQCAQCHRKIDPIGFGLENFNAAGKWREVDYDPRTKKEWPIDPAGAFRNGPAFRDYFELRDLVAARSDDFARGFTEALIEYALGRPYGFTDAALADGIVARAKAEDCAIRGFIQALVASETFARK
jgi:hypothetical protein